MDFNQTLKAIRNRILVRSYHHQKEALTITGKGGKVIELFIGKEYVENNREKNPVVAEVLDNNTKYDYIKKGDFILVHHNLIDRKEDNQYCVEYDPQTGIGLYSLPAGRHIFCVINKKTGRAFPVCGNVLAKRVENKIKSNIIIPDTVKQQYKNVFDVTAISKEVDFIKPGDRVIAFEYSDYEICYNWNKKDFSVIKIDMEEIHCVYD